MLLKNIIAFFSKSTQDRQPYLSVLEF